MNKITTFLLIIFTLYINEDILNSFTKVENRFNDKVWTTIMYSPQQDFFNSIWLTNKEFGLLVRFGEIKTKYKNQSILIKIID